ncbi:MAG: motility associated factor glycosyltransferase family protein [Desulfobacterales bacterium]|uniref:Motility associated factor glycosyltransferase family protein n=1 Tax=Candidatus Desulfatibia vada TaxID=2841696 RepID=A0A8J6NUP9_9BACT|nr:motility associated factor glycosyltransferase family protein [Candidatus Desulfatibia vada]
MDNEIFKKNLSALEEKYPALASKIKKNSIDKSRYKIIRTETGESNLLVAKNDSFIMLYDNASPYEYCKKFLEGMDIAYAPIVLFLGFGLGYHLHMFSQLYADKANAKKIIVFENDLNIFHLAMEMSDLSHLITHPDIHFFVREDPDDAIHQIRREILADKGTCFQIRSTKVMPLPANILLNDEYYRKALDITRMAFRQQMILSGNDPTDAFLGIENLLGNIKHIVSHPGISQLRDKFKGRPAITVASGPSLEKNMHLLRDIRDRALIISCDSNFLPLMKRDIRPHIVASLERTAGTNMFYESASDVDGIYLAFCPLIQPDVYDSFRGKKIIVFRDFSHFKWFHLDKGTLSIGPAVSNMAFKIAEYLGCDPIIMIGQDLAFAEDGDTHVEDMLFGERDENYHSSIIEAEGNYGSPVKTSRIWEIFKSAHEEDIRYYKGLCINATEGGVKIRGTQVMTFAEVIDTYCRNEFYPEAIIADSISAFEKTVNIPQELKFLLDRCIETRFGLKETINMLLEYSQEILEVQNNMIRPFMYEGKDVDSAYLVSIAEKFFGIMETFLKDRNVHNIMAHTVHPEVIFFTNKFNYLKDVYSREDCLHSAQILMIKDWLGVIGQLFVSTIDSLEQAEKMLAKELS